MSGYTVYPFPFGQLKIGCKDGAVIYLARTAEPVSTEGRTALTDLACAQVMEYLDRRRRSFDFPYLLRGTEFQQKVWQALQAIPYGQTRTYGQIAAAIGSPKAARAVGMANHKNPILLVVPCHRVVGADGSLTGYGSGLDMKAALLELERRGTAESKSL